ncbi:MAG: phosphoribosylglycinamide formyltransferase [Candidatus Omnitrophica bacterium]|nr:phosphoribosylglycinamide formyltransferase [Candidatus Omnitrophota bacterium]
MKRIAVFCSGEGTNLQAILDAVRTKRLKASLAVVVSDRPAAFALTRARGAGVETLVLRPREYPSRLDYEQTLLRKLKSRRIDIIVLAGFMRILSPAFVRAYRHRILNIHPALLPSFRGRSAVRDTLRHGVKVTGVTVHLVDEGVDTGPIVLQETVPVKRGDTEKTLHERIHRVEHRLYPKAIGLLLQEKLRIVGRKVEIVR